MQGTDVPRMNPGAQYLAPDLRVTEEILSAYSANTTKTPVSTYQLFAHPSSAAMFFIDTAEPTSLH